MKKASTICILAFLLFASTSLYSQNVCEDVNIVDVFIDPISMDRLILKVENNSEELFDYPGFKVFRDGTELGVEEVNFFGIGTESIHIISMENSFEDGEELDLTLELWVGFYDSLACTFEWTGKPYDSSECFELSFNMQWGGGSGDNLSVVMYDQTTEVEVFSTDDFFNVDNPTLNESICLEKGCYIYKVTSTESLASNYYINLFDTNYFSYYLGTTQEGDQGITDLVEVWEGCVTQSVKEQTLSEFTLYPNPSEGEYAISSFSSVQMVTVSDVGGRIVSQQNQIAHMPVLETAGMYLVTVLFEDGSRLTHQLIIE